MIDRDKRELLAGYVDGELSEDERLKFEQQLAQDPNLKAELEEFMKLQDLTGQMTYADLPDEVWESYWASLYRKLERGVGWIFFSLGAIALLSYAFFAIFYELFFDPTVPVFIKLAVPVCVVGLIILIVSFVRERLFAYTRDRYREVNK